jgi:hypothetical protein
VTLTKAPGVTYGSPKDNQLNNAIDILSRK